ncbi:hypothetical protein HDU98_002754 [Podochytrium sp. JEL0797]|nr:hypothetical protein HDU98_002754 [Podochytrium sp. JEL0797]
MFAFVAVIVALLGVVLYRPVERELRIQGVFPKVETGFAGVRGAFERCENIAALSSHTCTSLALSTPLGVLFASCDDEKANRALFSIHLDSAHETTRLDSSAAKANQFSALSLFSHSKHTTTLFATTNSTVEILTFTTGESVLVPVESVRDAKLLPHPTAVLPISPSSFYATTNPQNPNSEWLNHLTFLQSLSTSQILFRDAETDRIRVSAKDIPHATDLLASLDASFLFAATPSSGTVQIFKRNLETGSLKLAQRLQVHMYPESLSIDPTTGVIYVTGHTSYRGASKLSVQRKSVARIVANSGEDVFYGRPFKFEAGFSSTEDARVAGFSNVVVDSARGRTYFAGAGVKGVVVCEGVI